MEKHLDSMVMVARGASRNVRIVRIYPLTVLFTFTMVIIIYCILGLITIYIEITVMCYYTQKICEITLVNNSKLTINRYFNKKKMKK